MSRYVYNNNEILLDADHLIRGGLSVEQNYYSAYCEAMVLVQ